MAEKLQFVIVGEDGFSGAFGKLQTALPSIKTLALASAGAITGMGAALLATTKSTADAHDSVGKFASRIGITTEALSQYQTVAEFSGVSTETLNMGFQRMTRRISEAAQGTGVAVNALDELDISIESIQSLAPDQQFEAIAGALDGVANQSDKARLAMQFFDSEGVALLQTMEGGVEGLTAMKEEAIRFGTVVSTQAAANAAQFNDSLTRMGMAFEGLRNSIGERFMPILTELNNRFANFIADNRGAILDFGEKVITAFAWIAEKGAFAVGILVDAFRGVKMAVLAIEIGLLELLELQMSVFSSMADAALDFAEKINFGGVLDGMIEKLSDTKTAFDDTFIGTISEVSDTAKEQLLGIIDEGSMTAKVAGMVDTIKAGYAEVVEAAQIAAPEVQDGFVPDPEETAAQLQANVDAQAAALEQITAMHDEFFLTDQEKQQAWWEQQQELFAEGSEGRLLAEELHMAQMQELRTTARDQEIAEREEKEAQLAAIDAAAKQAQIQRTMALLGALQGLAQTFGKRGAKLAKALGISKALIGTYTGAAEALSSVPFPANIAAVATVIATGLAQVRQVQGVSVAHDGLTNVPRETTFLLDKGERVIKTRQNEDLTNFLANANSGTGGGGAGMTNNITIFPNATNVDAMLGLSESTWLEITEDKILPALSRLNRAGVTI